MHTVVSKSRIWGTRGDGLSGLECLLAVVGLEVTTEGSGLVQVRRDGGREFQILGTATLKLFASNDVWTNGAERRLVLESLREQVTPERTTGWRKLYVCVLLIDLVWCYIAFAECTSVDKSRTCVFAEWGNSGQLTDSYSWNIGILLCCFRVATLDWC